MYHLEPNQPATVDYPVWMGRALGELTNASKKVIVGVWFTISFPESGEGNEIVRNSMHFGTHPPGVRNPRNGDELEHGPEGVSLQSGLGKNRRSGTRAAPGETMQLPLGRDIDVWKPLLAEKHPIETYTKEQMQIDAVFFNDETVWAPGFFGRYDPRHPGHDQQITAAEFNQTTEPKRTLH